MEGGGCLYTVIQWKTAASVLQSGNWAHRTVEAKVHTIQKTMISVPSRKTRQCVENDIFRVSSLSSCNSCNSSSPDALAHER